MKLGIRPQLLTRCVSRINEDEPKSAPARLAISNTRLELEQGKLYQKSSEK
jgi:hypothetical protein